jgi:sulfonate transport system substrate-binding protein
MFFAIDQKTRLCRLLLGLASILMSGLVFAGTAGSNSEIKSVRVAMSLTPLSAPFIIAEDQKFFKRESVDVHITDFIGGHRSANALFSGEFDLATSSEVVVMFNSFARDDFSVLASFVSSNNDLKILSYRDAGIRNVADLVGHRVGIVTGSAAQFFLEETLLVSGVESDIVDMVHVDPEAMLKALSDRSVDAVAIWEPLAYQIHDSLKGDVLIVPNDKVYTETFNALVMREFARENPDILVSVLTALEKAIEFIHKKPQQAQKIVAERIGEDVNLIKAIWSDFSFELSLHQWLLTTLETQARWAIEQQLVDKNEAPNYLMFLDPSIIDRVKPESVTLFR